MKTDDLGDFNVGFNGGQRSRANTWHNVLVTMQKKTRALVAEREGKAPFDPFPSLVVAADGISAKGSYAEAQVGVRFCVRNWVALFFAFDLIGF